MTLLKTIMIAGILFTTTAAAMAGPIDDRQNRQMQRIGQGAQSGELTFHELTALVRGQQRIQAMKVRARADGFVDPWERAQIRTAQDWQSLNIYVKKHN
jgi:uncharacterized membrane protein YebE (DUF533 family)